MGNFGPESAVYHPNNTVALGAEVGVQLKWVYEKPAESWTCCSRGASGLTYNFQTNTWTTDSGEQYDTNGDLIERGSQMDIGDKKMLQECKKNIAGVEIIVSC